MELLDWEYPVFSGGTGSSENEAIIIRTNYSAVSAEYEYLERTYGTSWKLVSQSLSLSEAGKRIDILRIKLTKGSTISVFFDITHSGTCLSKEALKLKHE